MAARKPAKTVAFNNKYYVIVIRVILLVASDFSRPLLLTLNFFSLASFLEAASQKIGHHFRPNSNREEDRHVVLGFRDDRRPKRRRNHETRLHRASFLFSFLFFRGLSLCASFAGRNQNATTAKQNSDTRWGDGLERHLERLRSLPPQIFSSLTNDDVSFLFQNYLCRIKQRTKLQAEVMYFEQQIKQIMQNFGVECFPHMEQSNSGLVQQAFLNAQRGIEEYRAKIEEKNREINELNQQIDNVGR